jgi:6-phosphogluconate dehydrogenase (decarboxylating)
MTDTIAVIGLGAMGLPMASRLATRFTVSAFDSNQDRMALAATAGVRSAATPRDASEGADVVVLAVRDSGQVESALGGDDGVLAARSGVLVVTSTIGRDAIRRVAVLADEHGVPLVDAPVSGGPARAGCGDLLTGDGGRVARARCGRIVHVVRPWSPHGGGPRGRSGGQVTRRHLRQRHGYRRRCGPGGSVAGSARRSCAAALSAGRARRLGRRRRLDDRPPLRRSVPGRARIVTSGTCPERLHELSRAAADALPTPSIALSL